jgi:small subunit ribosomal protein S2
LAAGRRAALSRGLFIRADPLEDWMPSTFTISPKELLEAGVHFGHKVSRWNPKMAPFIYGKRNLIHIIDVRATIRGLIRACHFLEQVAARGELVLFVGTKRQAGPVVRKEAGRIGMPFVADRWIGGTLTNYATIRDRLKRLKEIETWEQDGTIHRYGKKEIASIMREKRKLIRNLDGIRTMDRLPGCVVVMDPCHEANAVAEADKIGAATVALIDTDGDPDKVDIAIPGNDDSLKVVAIVMQKLAESAGAGKARAVPVVRPEPAPQAVVSAGGRGGPGDRRPRLFGDRRDGGGGRGGGGRGRGPRGGGGGGGGSPAPAAPAAPPAPPK